MTLLQQTFSAVDAKYVRNKTDHTNVVTIGNIIFQITYVFVSYIIPICSYYFYINPKCYDYLII